MRTQVINFEEIKIERVNEPNILANRNAYKSFLAKTKSGDSFLVPDAGLMPWFEVTARELGYSIMRRKTKDGYRIWIK